MWLAHWLRKDANCALVDTSAGNASRSAFVATHFVSNSSGSKDSLKMNSANARNDAFRSLADNDPITRIIWCMGKASTEPFEICKAATTTAPVKCVDW